METKLGQENLLRMVRWHCPQDTDFEHPTLGHGGSPQYWIFTSERWGRNLFFLKLECQSGVRARDLRLSKQAAVTTTPGTPHRSVVPCLMCGFVGTNQGEPNSLTKEVVLSDFPWLGYIITHWVNVTEHVAEHVTFCVLHIWPSFIPSPGNASKNNCSLVVGLVEVE